MEASVYRGLPQGEISSEFIISQCPLDSSHHQTPWQHSEQEEIH